MSNLDQDYCYDTLGKSIIPTASAAGQQHYRVIRNIPPPYKKHQLWASNYKKKWSNQNTRPVLRFWGGEHGIWTPCTCSKGTRGGMVCRGGWNVIFIIYSMHNNSITIYCRDSMIILVYYNIILSVSCSPTCISVFPDMSFGVFYQILNAHASDTSVIFTFDCDHNYIMSELLKTKKALDRVFEH